ncbi:MAG: SDR family oxidoreductase [Candidatus Sulfotelmatobacter sp.]|jgi:dTDP-4-dehydrorhamnose reductase
MILVTGASGALGASLASLASSQGHAVAGVYHRHPVSIAGVRLFAADLTDEAELRRVFYEVKPSTVVHCAAAANVDWCEEHPEEAHRINVVVSARIAEIASHSNISLLHISTDSVFDGERGDYLETDEPGPVNIYAATKLLAEKEVLRRHPVAAIARVNFYGSRPDKTGFAESILNGLAAGNCFPGFCDVVFCPIFIEDLAEVLLAVLDRNLSGIYHVVGSEAVSKYEFARRLASTCGLDPGQVVATRIAEVPMRAARPQNTSLNTSKVCAALGRVMPRVQSGLDRFARLREPFCVGVEGGATPPRNEKC